MHSENAWVLYQYQNHMKEALGLNVKTIDARMRHALWFNGFVGEKSFRLITKDDIGSFKSRLVETSQDDEERDGQKSAATIVQTFQNLRQFLVWLGNQPGHRSMDRTLPDYCKPSRRHTALAKVKRGKHIPSPDEIRTLLASMPIETIMQRRDRAIVAFLFLTGVRDAALISLRLKHVDLDQKLVFQDATVVDTKFSKTMTTFWFPIGEDTAEIVTKWVLERRALATSDDEALFPRSPSAIIPKTVGSQDSFWITAAPVRDILKRATAAAGITYFVPHAVRSTLALLIDQIARTWEERKALSQNLGHEHIRTTEEHYGQLDTNRQRTLIDAMRMRPNLSNHDTISELYANATEERREIVKQILEMP
ncbi:MAG: site-specific integrase [Roseibium sp.]|uniref:tyrosine-type recombinase/integrase n=1 Tax=Roseibium sp. TaxID=1936156 RepID=UPI002607C371|nr:site-specific integrase [Roseibium sp.]MCV0428507.1 site-specific integrase [Roseibium sp.]